MKNLKKDFPALEQKINGQQLIYFDNAATTHKPQVVIDCISSFYAHEYGTIYRGIHTTAERTTTLYEDARQKIARFINAQPEEVVFTQGATGGINFVATAWAREHCTSGDEIVLTQMEHHANLIPWQQVARHTGAVLKFIPVSQDGILDLSDLGDIITNKTKLVTIIHVSNLLGTHNDIDVITKTAHAVGARILIDAAQSVPHQKVDVQQLNCDFLVFSGHKMMGPTGIGILYIKKDMHEQVDPYQFGGGMVFQAWFEDACWQQAPQKYEAGTPPIAQAVGLAAAVDYLDQNVDWNALQKHEAALSARMIDGLSGMKSVRIVGPVEHLKKTGHLVSFVVEGVHAHDVAAHFDYHGIAVRAGHSCAQPLANALNVDAVVRASFYLYNDMHEVDFFLHTLEQLLNP